MLEFSGKRVTVMGLGRFGGGVGVTRWLAAQGAEVTVTDLSPATDLAESVEAIAGLVKTGSVRLRLGEHNVSDFTTCDVVVANPAVPKPWENRFLRAASAAGIPVTTEIGVLIERLPDRRRVIGVTGSVGKSTTSAMIHHALKEVVGPSGERVWLGGNIGGSLLNSLGEITGRDWIVLELSSAMLWWIGGSNPAIRAIDRPVRLSDGAESWSPGIGLITNISANHVDWHGDIDHYTACKQVLVRSMDHLSAAVLVDQSVDAWSTITRAKVLRPSPQRWPLPMLLPGAHNVINAAGALEACVQAIGEEHRDRLSQSIAGFGGLVHRLQLVCERPAYASLAGAGVARSGRSEAGVRFYNDSKSTTPESCLRAIEAVEGFSMRGRRGIHLIAGGYDKNVSLQPIAEAAATLAGIYTIGATGDGLARASRLAGATASECSTLANAVRAAAKCAAPGDVVLMSPGCASWDQYVNYEARGEEFIRLARGEEDRP